MYPADHRCGKYTRGVKIGLSSAGRIYMSDLSERRAKFRQLHETGCFVIPNPWDAGSAIYLRAAGFPALATTSAGAAFSMGKSDGAVSRSAMLDHIEAIVKATELPVNADFEVGYAAGPEGVADSVRRCVEAGVAGLSLEDATRNPAKPLFPLDEAVERIRAARRAIDASGTGVLLTARAECYLVGIDEPLRESICRLQAYAEAGADVLYAPGPRRREDFLAIVQAVHPKPVNALALTGNTLTVAGYADLGVRRISVGSALARCAWGGFLRAVHMMAEEGSFAGLNDGTPFDALNRFFRTSGNSDIL